jgi:hypothetical protein
VSQACSQEGVEARALIIDDRSIDDRPRSQAALARRITRAVLRRYAKNPAT